MKEIDFLKLFTKKTKYDRNTHVDNFIKKYSFGNNFKISFSKNNSEYTIKINSTNPFEHSQSRGEIELKRIIKIQKSRKEIHKEDFLESCSGQSKTNEDIEYLLKELSFAHQQWRELKNYTNKNPCISWADIHQLRKKVKHLSPSQKSLKIKQFLEFKAECSFPENLTYNIPGGTRTRGCPLGIEIKNSNTKEHFSILPYISKHCFLLLSMESSKQKKQAVKELKEDLKKVNLKLIAKKAEKLASGINLQPLFEKMLGKKITEDSLKVKRMCDGDKNINMDLRISLSPKDIERLINRYGEKI